MLNKMSILVIFSILLLSGCGSLVPSEIQEAYQNMEANQQAIEDEEAVVRNTPSLPISMDQLTEFMHEQGDLTESEGGAVYESKLMSYDDRDLSVLFSSSNETGDVTHFSIETNSADFIENDTLWPYMLELSIDFLNDLGVQVDPEIIETTVNTSLEEKVPQEIILDKDIKLIVAPLYDESGSLVYMQFLFSQL